MRALFDDIRYFITLNPMSISWGPWRAIDADDNQIFNVSSADINVGQYVQFQFYLDGNDNSGANSSRKMAHTDPLC